MAATTEDPESADAPCKPPEPPPAAAVQEPGQHYSLTWLISQLMHSEPHMSAKCMGQPNREMRDRILELLRPMMNFSEKVTYFWVRPAPPVAPCPTCCLAAL